MPAIRAVYLTHPSTGVPGIWVEPSGSPPGTLVGRAQTAFPNVTGGDTEATWLAKSRTALRTLIPELDIQLVLTSLRPLVIESVIVGEGDSISVTVH